MLHILKLPTSLLLPRRLHFMINDSLIDLTWKLCLQMATADLRGCKLFNFSRFPFPTQAFVLFWNEKKKIVATGREFEQQKERTRIIQTKLEHKLVLCLARLLSAGPFYDRPSR